MQPHEQGEDPPEDSRYQVFEYPWDISEQATPNTPSVARTTSSSASRRISTSQSQSSNSALHYLAEAAESQRPTSRGSGEATRETRENTTAHASKLSDSRTKSTFGTPINTPGTSTAPFNSPLPEAKLLSPTDSELIREENAFGYVNMAHCQLNGPLHGPLRERRRSNLSKDHVRHILSSHAEGPHAN
jgi:hypothetical protein